MARVSDVGDLLELLHGARDRWRTFRGTVRTWHHLERQRLAAERWSRIVGAQQYVFEGTGSRPETQEWSERLWIAKPDRVRREAPQFTTVQRGALWWSWSEHRGFTSNERDPEVRSGDPLQEYAAHLDPAVLLPQIDIDRVEGRRVHVRPRAAEQYGPGLPHGADLHVLDLAESGVVLAVESFVGGEPFFRSQLVDAVWDEELPEETFVLEIPPGAAVHSTSDFHRAHITIDEAAAGASIAVFAAAELPDGAWRSHAFHDLPRGDAGEESVTILYHRIDGRGAIHLVERPAGENQPWSRLVGAAEVTVERDGTAVTLHSQDYDEESLRHLAENLVRV